MGVSNAVAAIPKAVAPLVGGLMADRLGGYVSLFAVSAVLLVVSLLMTLRAKEPRYA